MSFNVISAPDGSIYYLDYEISGNPSINISSSSLHTFEFKAQNTSRSQTYTLTLQSNIKPSTFTIDGTVIDITNGNWEENQDTQTITTITHSFQSNSFVFHIDSTITTQSLFIDSYDIRTNGNNSILYNNSDSSGNGTSYIIKHVGIGGFNHYHKIQFYREKNTDYTPRTFEFANDDILYDVYDTSYEPWNLSEHSPNSTLYAKQGETQLTLTLNPAQFGTIKYDSETINEEQNTLNITNENTFEFEFIAENESHSITYTLSIQSYINALSSYTIDTDIITATDYTFYHNFHSDSFSFVAESNSSTNEFQYHSTGSSTTFHGQFDLVNHEVQVGSGTTYTIKHLGYGDYNSDSIDITLYRNCNTDYELNSLFITVNTLFYTDAGTNYPSLNSSNYSQQYYVGFKQSQIHIHIEPHSIENGKGFFTFDDITNCNQSFSSTLPLAMGSNSFVI